VHLREIPVLRITWIDSWSNFK